MMIKILLADSDAENIRTVRTLIRNVSSELRVVVSISDRLADLSTAIDKFTPQLIVADIRFFGVSAYQAVKDLHERYHEIGMIVYGAFADGEYMKRTLDYGVIDYLFKPVKSADLQRCMNSASDFIRRQEERKKRDAEIERDYAQQLYLYKNVFLNTLVSGHVNNTREINYAFRYFNLQFENGYTVLVIRIDHYKKVVLALDEREKHLLTHRILGIARQKLALAGGAVFIGELNSLVAITGGFDSVDDAIVLCEELKDGLLQDISLSVTIGIGRTYERPTDICISYKEALSALRYSFQIGYNTVIPIHFVEPQNSITYRYPIEKEERLVYTAALGEYEYCRTLLLEIFGALRECGELPARLLPKIVFDILISINRYLSEKNVQINDQFTTYFPSKDIFELKDLDKAFEYLDAALKNFCSYIGTFYDDTRKRLIEAAKAYMDTRYFETFSLQKISVELGMTPEYLNKAFYDSEKRSMLDYIVSLRLAEAKRLMRETEYDDDMVAVKSGYDDGRHFRSVFKQYEGVSTSEYRAKFNLFNNQIKPLANE